MSVHERSHIEGSRVFQAPIAAWGANSCIASEHEQRNGNKLAAFAFMDGKSLKYGFEMNRSIEKTLCHDEVCSFGKNRLRGGYGHHALECSIDFEAYSHVPLHLLPLRGLSNIICRIEFNGHALS